MGAHPHARGGAAFIAIPVDTVVRSGRLRSPMKLKTPSSFVAVVCAIVMLLAAGLSSVGSGQPAAQEESPAELNQRIPKLYQQGKYEEAIPLAEKLVVSQDGRKVRRIPYCGKPELAGRALSGDRRLHKSRTTPESVASRSQEKAADRLHLRFRGALRPERCDAVRQRQ